MSCSRSSNLSRAVHCALLGGALVAPEIACAQTIPSTAGATSAEVIVTGSRIALPPNQVSISPVTEVTAADLQLSGMTRIEDVLNQLPQLFAAQGAALSNGADGTAQLDLRHLGAQRTLVLLDGRRLGPGDPRGNNAADVNQIPGALVESVEVLTGGASSVYGADAVAGVVNFKLNRHFEGAQFRANFGFNSHHQDNDGLSQTVLADHNANVGTSYAAAPNSVTAGFSKDLSFILGMNTAAGNGNASAYVTYREVAAVLQAKYDYSACGFSSGYVTDTGRFDCSGSLTSYPGRFQQYDPVSGGTIGGAKTIGSGGTLIPFTRAYRYNFGPLNFYQRPDERWMAGLFAQYAFNERADVYTELQFMDDRSVSQIAPSGAFFGAPITVNCSNPYLSAAMVAAWCTPAGMDANGNILLGIGRRNVEGGGRTDDLRHQAFRVVIGVNGVIADGWRYDAYGQYGSTTLSETYQELSKRRIGNALQAVPAPDGTVVCKNSDAVGCSPWNIFQPGIPPSAASRAYIGVPLNQTGAVTQKIASVNVVGDLGRHGIRAPAAQSGLKVTVGAEWRDVFSRSLPDLEFQTADGAGLGGPVLPVAGGVISRDVYAEANLPLVDGKPGARALAIDSGYRYSEYSLGFRTSTYKIGLEWAPLNEVRLRGSWARSVRAPNVGELYSTQSVGIDGSTDPCAGTINPATGLLGSGYTPVQCALTGVSAAQYGNILENSANQYNGSVGGNPNLRPETATTRSAGVQWSPSLAVDLRATVDWYDINIRNVINQIGADNVLSLCLKSDLYCNLIHRDLNGSLWLSANGFVEDTLNNSSALEQKGVDVDLSYAMTLTRYGRVRVTFNGTYIISAITTPISAVPTIAYDCAGYYGLQCGTPTQRWRQLMRIAWTTPWAGADISLAWRYYGPVTLDKLNAQPNLRASDPVTPGASNEQLITDGFVSNTDAHLSSRSYLDLTGSVNLREGLNLRIGINNLLDKSPPLVGSSNLPGVVGNGNTFPQVYDSLGRYVFAALTAQF